MKSQPDICFLSFRQTLIFLLIISATAVFGQKADSLLQIANTKQGNEKAKILIEVARDYKNQEDSVALNYINQAIELSANKRTKGEALFQKGAIYLMMGHDLNGVKYLDEAADFLKGENDTIRADAYYWVHRTYQRIGMYPEALNAGITELEVRKQIGENQAWLNAMSEIGYTYDRMNEYYKAIEWHKRTLKHAQRLNIEAEIGASYGLIGIAYDELKEYDSALLYNFKAVEYFKKLGNKGKLATWYSNIGNTYTKTKQLNEAEKYTRLALKTGNQITPNSVTLINLGKILLERGKFAEAEIILDSAMIEVRKTGEKRFLSEAYYRFHELRKKQNNFLAALNYYEQYKATEDEMFTEAKAKQINELSIQYETAEKEKEILVNRAELAESQLKLSRREYQLLGLIGLAVGIGLLGYLFWNQQKLKNNQLVKENELKDALLKIETQNKLQEQRLRISRDLHDNIGAQLTFIISSLDNLKYGFNIENEQLNKKINRISQFTSDTIFELRDTIWAMNQSEITLEDLQTRISNFIEKADLTQEQTNFNINISSDIKNDIKFSSVQGINVYRIIQESVNNAIKYADAHDIKVEITRQQDLLKITIEDDGNGFDLSQIKSGNGLNNMRKRAADLGSQLVINSQKNHGTKVSFDLNTKNFNYI